MLLYESDIAERGIEIYAKSDTAWSGPKSKNIFEADSWTHQHVFSLMFYLLAAHWIDDDLFEPGIGIYTNSTAEKMPLQISS